MKPSESDIRRRAFDIFQFRQQYRIDGTAEGDWEQAEQDLTDDPEYWKSLEEDWR